MLLFGGVFAGKYASFGGSTGGGEYQYKLVSISQEDLPKLMLAMIGATTNSWVATKDKETIKTTAEANLIIERTINAGAKGGWEYVESFSGLSGGLGTTYLFRKKI